jgi:hypothetical protein
MRQPHICGQRSWSLDTKYRHWPAVHRVERMISGAIPPCAQALRSSLRRGFPCPACSARFRLPGSQRPELRPAATCLGRSGRWRMRHSCHPKRSAPPRKPTRNSVPATRTQSSFIPRQGEPGDRCPGRHPARPAGYATSPAAASRTLRLPDDARGHIHGPGHPDQRDRRRSRQAPGRNTRADRGLDRNRGHQHHLHRVARGARRASARCASGKPARGPLPR